MQGIIDEFARIGVRDRLQISKVISNEQYEFMYVPKDLKELLSLNIQGISLRCADLTVEIAEFCAENGV